LQSATVQTGSEFKTSPQSPEFRSVDRESLGIVWPIVEPMVRRALKHGQGDAGTAEGLLRKVYDGDLQMWAILIDGEITAAVILSVLQLDVCSKVWVHVIAGKRSDLWAADISKLLLDFKELTGAKCVEASCRPGAAKVMKSVGWRQKAVIMELS
jgi:hypothetical protein